MIYLLLDILVECWIMRGRWLDRGFGEVGDGSIYSVSEVLKNLKKFRRLEGKKYRLSLVWI